MSDIKKDSRGKPIKIGKKYFIKIGGAAYPHNQGKVRRVLRETIQATHFTIENTVEDVPQGTRDDHVNLDDLVSLKDFKYQVGDKVKVKKSYTPDSYEAAENLAGTEQTILRIDPFDDELPIKITAPTSCQSGRGAAEGSYWVGYKDIKIVSRPLK